MFSPEMHIGIVGNGKMGAGIFQYLTDFRFKLSLVCERKDQVDTAKAVLEKKTARLLKNGIITPVQTEKRLNSIFISSDLSILNTADLIIEAVPEEISLKMKLFTEIEKLTKPDCIFTSNTSSIPPSELFENMMHKENCAGLHFFYPVNLKDLAEINASSLTSPGTKLSLQNFLTHINKFHLTLNEPDIFIINKIFLDIQAEACRILSEGLMTIGEIDQLVDEHLFPGGIFLFFDHVGIDVMYASVANYSVKFINRANYCVILNSLKVMLDNGLLGIKNGKGFYDHSSGTIMIRKKELLISSVITSCLERLMAAFYQSLNAVIQKEICDEQQLDYIVKEYTGADTGPFEKKLSV
jgi:3-hydroxybutyryl-CoA dehydrogenase